jgi:hypothetical protein
MTPLVRFLRVDAGENTSFHQDVIGGLAERLRNAVEESR